MEDDGESDFARFPSGVHVVKNVIHAFNYQTFTEHVLCPLLCTAVHDHGVHVCVHPAQTQLSVLWPSAEAGAGQEGVGSVPGSGPLHCSL